MPTFRKIFFTWIGTLLALVISFLLPHEDFTRASFLSYSLQLLLFILSIYLTRYETVRKNKFIFLNFSLFFGVSLLFHLYNFVGTIFFVTEPRARLYYFQYVSAGLYFFLLAFAIGYLTIDLLFRDFKTFQKYLLALAIVGGFFANYYRQSFSNPGYLYTTNEIRQWKELDKASTAYAKKFGEAPTLQQLSAYVPESGAQLLNQMGESERLECVAEYYPYLSGSNYLTLLLKPVYVNAIKMCVLSIGFILLFFGYQYRKDPPQGAYIEKMMFFFLMFCTLEVFHAWSFIKAIEWQSFSEFVVVGQYLSAVLLVCIAIFFALRLRFITSAKGDFYEHEIIDSPAAVTRWRDSLDNLVIEHFFNRTKFVGRLFVDPKFRKQQQ